MPERNQPWPYAERHGTEGPPTKSPPPPALLARRLAQRLGLHPDDDEADAGLDLLGRRALVVCTNHGVLDIGKATGVFASEMTVPYYLFLDAGMVVDLASPAGGTIPVDPLSLKPVVRTADDDRFLADDELRAKVGASLAVGELDPDDYDVVYLAGGWGAAFDFGTSDGARRAGHPGQRAWHGDRWHVPRPPRPVQGHAPDGRPLVEGRRVSAVTDKQVHELGITATPMHPERELRAQGARFESATRFRDPLANHWVVDGNLVTGQNQNAGPMVARELMRLVLDREDDRTATEESAR